MKHLGKIKKKKFQEEESKTNKHLNKKVLSYEEAAKKIQEAGGSFRLATPEDTAPEITAPLDNAQIELLAEIERRRKALKDLIDKQLSDEEKKAAEKRRKDAFELAKALLKIEIEKQKDIMNNAENSLEERLNANKKYLDKNRELIELEAEFETNTPKITSFKVKQIEAEKQNDLTKLTKEGLDNRDKIIQSDFDKQLDFYNKIKEISERSLDSEIAQYQNKLIKQGLSREEIEKKVSQKEKEIRKDNLKNFLENEITKLKAIAVTAENRERIAREIAKLEMLLSDLSLPDTKEIDVLANRVNNFLKSFSSEAMSEFGFNTLNELLTIEENGKSVFENLLEKAKKTGQEFGFIFTSITEVAQEAFNFLNSQQDAYFENQLFRLEQERDIAIQFAGDSATAREEIERQYEEKRREIQQKQAEAQREQALFNILINTAQGVIAALASVPPNVPLSIAIGVIGAAQAAIVASTPIPEFFRGTMNAPEGWAMVDEKEPEIHTDRQGNIKSFGKDKANMRYLDKGDKIYKTRELYFQKELGNILEDNDILPYNQMFDMVAPVINIDSGIKKEDFRKEIRDLKTAIINKPTSVTNIDKSGVETYLNTTQGKRRQQNNILTLKGGIV
jgi:hypothetical protein